YADWWNPVVKNPIRVDQGMAIIDGALGTGVDWNEDMVSKFSV
ncbi:unnamed protein product, partial [marine sediment metagenome]